MRTAIKLTTIPLATAISDGALSAADFSKLAAINLSNLLLGGAAASPNATIAILGSKTIAVPAAGSAWNAIDFQASTLTLAAGGVAPTSPSAVYFAAPTITSPSAYTVPSAATVTIAGAPVAGGSAVLTNSYALQTLSGVVRFTTNGRYYDFSDTAEFVRFSSANMMRIGVGNTTGSIYIGIGDSPYDPFIANYVSKGFNFISNSLTIFMVSSFGDLQIGGTFPANTYTATSTKLRVQADKTIASAASAVYDGVKFAASAVSITGATAITTAGGFNYFTVQAPTITGDTATCVISKAGTLVVTGAPISGANVTITTPLAVDIQAGNVCIASLAGTGTRNVVVDANGVLSAP